MGGYNIGSYHSNAWKSSNPNSGVYATEQSKTLDALETAEKRIEELEAKIPKEGEWIVDKKGYPQIICSLCDVHIPMVAGWCMDAHINYCPNCGARMRKGEENER